MKEIVQYNHSVGYWMKGKRNVSENFIELANFAIKFIRHVSMPKSLALRYPDLNSGFLAEVSQLRGGDVIKR